MINEQFFANPLWKESRPIYEKILEHPFIIELTQGVLSKERFTYYLQQDSLYLIDFARALAYIAAKVTKPSEIISFLQFAIGAIIGERELQEDYFKCYKIIPCDIKSKACLTYTQYLMSVAEKQSVEEAIAAVLPCFWVYRDVGITIHNNASKDNHPYEKWINAYSNKEFSLIVDKAIGIAEIIYNAASPLTQQMMQQAAQESVHLEWQFWDAAYNPHNYQSINN